LHKNVYQVEQCEILSRDISRIQLKSFSHDFIHYEAGQYINVLHHDERISPMSIACAPVDKSIIELHLHHPPENSQAMDLYHCAINDKKLIVCGPFGICTASKIKLDKPIIFIANGTGLAPIKAVMEELVKIKKLPPIYLYWYADQFCYLQNEIEKWKINFTITSALSFMPMILEKHPDLSNYQIYMVDAGNTVFSALSVFMQHGLQKEFFYSDLSP
jgi:CDP-4-dehydro-6-deoxyglucose reductase